MLLSLARHWQTLTCQDHTPSPIRELNVGPQSLQMPWPALAAWYTNVEDQDAPEGADR